MYFTDFHIKYAHAMQQKCDFGFFLPQVPVPYVFNSVTCHTEGVHFHTEEQTARGGIFTPTLQCLHTINRNYDFF